MRFYIEAFFVLSGFRMPGFSGAGPIPLEAILRYGELFGYTSREDQLYFLDVIRALDSVFMAYSKEKSDEEAEKRKRKKSSAPPPRKGRRR